MSETCIRSLAKDDLSKILDIVENCGPYISPRTMSDYWLYTELFSDTCLGAFKGDLLVGIALCFLNQVEERNEAYIQDFAVSPDHRKEGIGQKLLSELIERLSSNVQSVWLTSEAGNQPAADLWGRFGFVNEKADYVENGLWVSKDLKGPGKDRIIFRKTF